MRLPTLEREWFKSKEGEDSWQVQRSGRAMISKACPYLGNTYTVGVTVQHRWRSPGHFLVSLGTNSKSIYHVNHIERAWTMLVQIQLCCLISLKVQYSQIWWVFITGWYKSGNLYPSRTVDVCPHRRRSKSIIRHTDLLLDVHWRISKEFRKWWCDRITE